MKKRNRREKRAEKLIGKVFVGCVLFLIILNLIVPNKKMSEEENRMLAQRPELTWSNVVSGDYMKKYETYMADQFAGRNLWRSFKLKVSRFGGSKIEQGVVIGKHGQLMEEITEPNHDSLSENLKGIKDFAKKNKKVKVHMMLVPDAAQILKKDLPKLATFSDQSKMMEQVKTTLGKSVTWIDVAKTMEQHKGEKIYYKTDHHWTSLGAFYTFKENAKALGIKENAWKSFKEYTIATDFNGSLASKSGCRLKEKEEISIYTQKEGKTKLVINYVEEKRKTASLYDSSKLKTKDKYAVFLGGNTAVIDIKTTSTSKKRLLLVKDSFANSFIPFLAPYYREIVVVDPRYYSGTMDEIMDNYKISDALFLYSGNTFFQDNNISGVFQ